MYDQNSDDELTQDQIRLLLRDRAKSTRRLHLRKYRQTGRAIVLSGDADDGSSEISSSFTPPGSSAPASHARLQQFFRADRVLHFVEFIAFIGLILLLWTGSKALATINFKSKTGWNLEALTPTPLIQAIILPDGHTSPNLPGGARPKIEEFPSHLRSLLNLYASIPTPTPAPQQGVRIQIPVLGIDAPVVQGDGWEQLKKGVAQHTGSANPGEIGNIVLSGHNDVYGEVFRYLDRLKKGDQITVFTVNQAYTYIVEEWFLVEPDQVEVMAPTPDETLTLISCYPYLIDSQRIIVKARLAKG